jgi:5-methylcytosine-specific restriction endonuclease McrA
MAELDDAQLPEPGSVELAAFRLSKASAAIYELLYHNRGNPLGMLEIRSLLQGELGAQEQLDRRRRDLNPFFEIEKSSSGKETRYRLLGLKATRPESVGGISERVRAEVLQFGRCAMCGRTVADHGVTLQVDHKMPQRWGGTDDIENLQPLCEPCNRGKKAHFTTLDSLGSEIREASQLEEPQRRIAALLKAAYPEEVRSDVLEMVAHQIQYQEDWQRRLRDLRFLGWDYDVRKRKDSSGRVRTYYRLTKWKELPQDIRAAISAEESRRRRT